MRALCRALTAACLKIRYVDYFFHALGNGGKAPFDTPPTLALTGLRFSPPPYIDRLETLR